MKAGGTCHNIIGHVCGDHSARSSRNVLQYHSTPSFSSWRGLHFIQEVWSLMLKELQSYDAVHLSLQRYCITGLLTGSSVPLLLMEGICHVYAGKAAAKARRTIFTDTMFCIFGNILLKKLPRICLFGVSSTHSILWGRSSWLYTGFW